METETNYQAQDVLNGVLIMLMMLVEVLERQTHFKRELLIDKLANAHEYHINQDEERKRLAAEVLGKMIKSLEFNP